MVLNPLIRSVFNLVALAWADILIAYAMWMLMIYLTDVWKLAFTHSAGIINVYMGLTGIMPLFMQFIADTVMGNYWMLLFSSLAYCTGMGFLTMSTPPPECIGDTQHILFYAALALIAVGTAGHVTSLASFLGEQLMGAIENISTRSIISAYIGNIVTFFVSVVAVLGLPYIKPWSLHFGIPTICILVATIIFLSGSRTYTYVGPQGSHLTMVLRVLVAAASKLFRRHPADRYELHGMSDCPLPRTRFLRCLDKAALVLPDQSLEQQQNNRWRLCTVTEVEATKLIIDLIPMAISFIFLGLLSSLGYTYFIEQAKNMNHKVGSLAIPLTIFFWFYIQAKMYFPALYFSVSGLFCGFNTRTVAPVIGIMVSMVLGALCCVTAAKVESHRLHVVKSHGLLDKPDERIPLSVFWLLPQFILLGAVEGMFEISAAAFFDLYFTPALNRYMLLFGCVVHGLGCIGSILSVYAVGKVSERGGMPSWFQDTLNKSRLDNYYWFLCCLCAINLVLYVVIRFWYAWRSTDAQDQDDSEDSSCCCCCFRSGNAK
ncbi:unnamed protein product [Coffea canephora]|uniref:Protein NRT1/ PTR FAMILY 5.5-like n=1 Tax=Coffea canephora TaxID=49390 RepID=A0A068UD64_COFCA|nr:unnamed protein product [Coffea canephora]